MPNSNQLGLQLQDIMKQYQAYTPVDSNDISNQLMAKVGNFQPQYQEIANNDTKAFAYPAQGLSDFNSQFGTNGGPSAMVRLQSVLENMGRMYGTSDVLRGVLDTQKGRIGDLAGQVFGQYNQQRSGVMDRYNMVNDQYKTVLAREEQERQRRAAQVAANNQQSLLNKIRLQQEAAQKAQQDAINIAKDRATKFATGMDGKFVNQADHRGAIGTTVENKGIVMGYENGKPIYGNPSQGARDPRFAGQIMGNDGSLGGQLGSIEGLVNDYVQRNPWAQVLMPGLKAKNDYDAGNSFFNAAGNSLYNLFGSKRQ